MRCWTVIAALMLACSMSPLAAPAAEYPDQPVKIVVPFPAGGFIDSVARIATENLSRNLGKPLVVENKGGAGGKIGEEFAANSQADGYTLIIGLVIRPTLMQALEQTGPEIDITKVFIPIGPIGSAAMVLNISPRLGVKDFKSFIEKIKSEPGKHNFASVGVGTPSHIISTQLARQLGLNVVHTPYRGGPAALQDLAAGLVSWVIDTPTGSLPLIQANRVIPVAVINPTRVEQLADVPTLTELGNPSLKDGVMAVYLMAPTGTPKPIIDRLSSALMALQADGNVRSRLENIAFQPAPPTNVQQTQALVQQQIQAWDKAVKEAIEVK